MRPILSEQLIRLIRQLKPVEAQNRLMRVADRELALAMLYMEDHDRSELLALVSPSKARRIREEYGFTEKRAVRYDQYLVAIRGVIAQLSLSRPQPPMRSYLRPRQNRGKERDR